MQSKEWSTKKKIVAGIIAVLLIFALIIGIIYIAVYSNRGKVIVVPLDDITYYDDEDDEANIEGTISTGVTQDVTLDQGNVTEILVEQGAYVKKGDALVRFDSTAANMQLEQARINLEGLKVDLTTANNKLTMLDQAEKYVETVKVPVTDITDETTTDTTSTTDTTATDTTTTDTTSTTDTTATTGTTATTDTTGTAADTTATTDTTGTTTSDTTSATDDATDSEEEVEYQEVEVESDEQQYKTSDGTIYTETELRKEKNSTKATILGLQTDIKEAEMEIEEAQKTVKECTVYATIDGYITKANTAMISSAEDLTAAAETGEDESDESEESEDTEAIITNGSDFSQTSVFTDNIVVQVSSMDGLYVDSAMSEWKLQRFGIGDVVYVLDWQSGNTYEATITYISQYASESYTQMYQEMGGSASSYYPFTAQITEDGTNLSAGDSVDISFTKPVEGSDIFEEYFEDDSEDTSDDEKEDSEEEYYILKAFVISENGKKYIYVRDENGLLEKKEISVASQTQETYRVTEGIEGDEYVAFPYGKNVRKGAKTVEGSIDDLYEE